MSIEVCTAGLDGLTARSLPRGPKQTQLAIRVGACRAARTSCVEEFSAASLRLVHTSLHPTIDICSIESREDSAVPT